VEATKERRAQRHEKTLGDAIGMDGGHGVHIGHGREAKRHLAVIGRGHDERALMTTPDHGEMTLRFATVADVNAVAAIHADRIAEGFLVTLGPAFLRRLY